MEQLIPKSPESPGAETCGLTGPVGGPCACDYATVSALNRDHIYPTLTKITELPFFRYFKVDLRCECPLWEEDGMCALQSCSVQECCDRDPVPEPLLQPGQSLVCESNEANVDRQVEEQLRGEQGSLAKEGPFDLHHLS